MTNPPLLAAPLPASLVFTSLAGHSDRDDTLGSSAVLPSRPANSTPPPAPAFLLPRRTRRLRRILLALGVTVSLVVTSFVATRTLPWFGPLVADTLRATVGSERVTWLEEVAAHVEDRVQATTSDGSTRGWNDSLEAEMRDLGVPPAPSPLAVVSSPTNVGPLHENVQAADDGTWRVVPLRGTNEPLAHGTLIHPDATRSYAELFVFALDLSRVEIHAVAGSVEPRRDDDTAHDAAARPGVVPAAHRAALVAAFNGGFKAEHGHYGMMSNGVEWLGPKKRSCTFTADVDGHLTIAPWTRITDDSSLSWWRQTPECMVESGVLHAGLRAEGNKNWGATLEGDTVIRRSAVGLSDDGRFLFVGVGNSLTAPALARGMVHAGAAHVAQLDVNFSYPRFLTYQDTPDGLIARGAVRGLLYEPDEYLGHASKRDFFYVTRR